MDEQLRLFQQLEAARAAGLPASTITGCACDFCTGKKKHEDNWCSRCTNVKMKAPKWWENCDVCDQCEREMAEGAES
jgi:hypothetical protein